MDTSEQYVNMCDCEEVQGNEPRGSTSKNFYHRTIPLTDSVQDFLNASIWLPRQDQIQEMFKLNMTELICGIHDWYCEESGGLEEFDSMEQLLLAFYMEKVHHKQWNRRGMGMINKHYEGVRVVDKKWHLFMHGRGNNDTTR